jgi:glycosyltransferase involved in cell wall biosynthesis
MRIAQLAPTYERVPPAGYGGTESMVSLLTEALVRRGHDVTLYASGDSVTSARLRSVTDRPHRYGDATGIRHPEHVHLANAQACFEDAAAGAFDVVHNHAGLEGLVLAATSRTPVLTTNHNAYAAETAAVWARYPWFHNAVSAASAATFPTVGALAPVHHGLDAGDFEPRLERGDYLLFLGRFAPEKGAAQAIDVARRTGRRLVLAGKVDAQDRAHFDRAVAPHVDGDTIRLAGEVAGEAKRRLLAGADALLFPIDWAEPFGLVMVEALMSATPVIGLRRASVPEIVDDGETGFVVDDIDGMVEAVGRLETISRARCRTTAEARFGLDRMVDEYEVHYGRVAGLTAPAAGSASGTVVDRDVVGQARPA